jgi:predicted DCC family thiol-disulfide oxidoreductase YuxK
LAVLGPDASHASGSYHLHDYDNRPPPTTTLSSQARNDVVDATPVDRPVLLYDGHCGFCARSVQFVLRHEAAQGTLLFARLEGPLGVALRRRHPELAGIDSLIWYEPASSTEGERLLWRSRGVRRVGRYLGGIWAVLSALGSIVPTRLLDGSYDWIARHRHQLAGDACVVPTTEQRRRFIDL